MSLYRKYRPRTFADVVNQQHVVSTLQNASAQGTLGHAYLFAGPRGTGKTTMARLVAKEMLTHGITDEKLQTQIRQAVDDGTIVDLVEIDAASNRGIDDIRTLIEKIQFSPVVAAAKVYIIDEVHMLTREAFNALLKTLEEPPPYAFFILATTELQKIPPTIQSRCQRFAFRQVSDEDIVGRLEFIATEEKITIDRPALFAIARHAQGGVRDAISLLDQLRSLPHVTLADVEQKIGSSTQQDIDGILTALESGDAQVIIDRIRALEAAGTSLDTFARQLLAEVRKRMHAALDQKQPIHAFVQLTESLLAAIRDMRLSPVPGLALEAALLSLSIPTPSASTAKKEDAPKKKLSRAEAKAAAAAALSASNTPPTTPSLSSDSSVSSASSDPSPPSALIQAPELTIQAVEAVWRTIVKEVESPSVRMSLKNSRISAVRGNVIVLTFSSAFHRDKVKHVDAAHNIEELLIRTFKQPIRIDCILEEDAGATVAAREDLVNLAEAAAEVF